MTVLSDYIAWCVAHGTAGQLLLIATCLGIFYLGACLYGALFERD